MRKAILSSMVVLGLLAAFVVPQQVEGQGLTYVGPDCYYTGAYIGFSPFPVDCAGAFSGNDNNLTAVYNQFVSEGWGTDWTYVGKTEAGSVGGPFSYVPGTPTGTVNFATPFTGQFILILKTATKFSAYLFPSVTGLTAVDYTTLGVSVNAQGTPQGLSHASLWKGSTNVVPEPSTFILLGTGLLGLGIVGYRRRNQA